MEDLLRILLYFDVFSYPLTADELFHYANINGRQKEALEKELQDLAQEGLINNKDGFFSIGDKKDAVRQRIEGNKRAVKRLKTARRYSRIIASFPFVRGVYLSGSISKGYAAPDDDIDYFIVTHPGRLWLARSLLILFKKIFLGNSYRNFCINYFVDTNHLAIDQQNRFTATEVAFLLPTYNGAVHKDILQANSWIKRYYPIFSQNGEYLTKSFPAVKGWVERLLNNGIGTALDSRLYSMSKKIIRKKHNHMDEGQFASCFSIKPHELKYLPNRQQYRIMKAYYRKLASFELQSGLELINGAEKQVALSKQ